MKKKKVRKKILLNLNRKIWSRRNHILQLNNTGWVENKFLKQILKMLINLYLLILTIQISFLHKRLKKNKPHRSNRILHKCLKTVQMKRMSLILMIIMKKQWNHPDSMARLKMRNMANLKSSLLINSSKKAWINIRYRMLITIPQRYKQTLNSNQAIMIRIKKWKIIHRYFP